MKTRLRFVLTFAVLSPSVRAPAGRRARGRGHVDAAADSAARRDASRRWASAGDPQAFADLTGQPMGAIVSLGGCSASFVSPDGLIVTNHHCVQGALQFNSTPQRNLWRTATWRRRGTEELSARPGLARLRHRRRSRRSRRRSRARSTRSSRTASATRPSRSALKERDGRLREGRAALPRRVVLRGPEVLRDRPDGDPGRAARLRAGRRASATSAARPTTGSGRATPATGPSTAPTSRPDGKPVAYAKDNVPFKPKHWLKVSPEGAKPGRPRVRGRLPRTDAAPRHLRADASEIAEWTFPRTVRRNTELIAILDEVGKKSKETAIRVATRKRGLNNTLTNRKGVVEGFKRGNLLAKKEGDGEGPRRRGSPRIRPGRRGTATSFPRSTRFRPRR